MTTPNQIEAADRLARKRPAVLAAAGASFGIIYTILHPYFDRLGDPSLGLRRHGWAINAVLLLIMLAMGSGFLNRTRMSRLINDEVGRENCRRAINASFWVAMIAAMSIYFFPQFAGLHARQVVYIIVTSAATVGMLWFAWLEFQANRDV